MVFALIGFMGCGKSSVGKRVARMVDFPFYDLDDLIVQRAGKSIPQIFSEDGEPAFRKMELETLAEFLARPGDAVLALGGGTPVVPQAGEMLHEGAVTVYLSATPATIVSHLRGELDSRPLLKKGGEKAIEEIMEVRLPIYERVADEIICVDGLSFEQECTALKECLERRMKQLQ